MAGILGIENINNYLNEGILNATISPTRIFYGRC
jgi:hypothetical protein